MGPKAHSKAQNMDVPEDGPEKAVAAVLPMIMHPREEHLGPADLDSITSMLQQCPHFQCDLSKRWDK